MTWMTKNPDNSLPASEYADVKVVNATPKHEDSKEDIVFRHSYGRPETGGEGDIVLFPQKYTFRKTFAVKHWFGDWTKEGAEWAKELRRLSTYYGPTRDAKGNFNTWNPLAKVWEAIQNHEIYVEGHTDKKDYSGATRAEYTDTKPSFDLNSPVNSMELMEREKQSSRDSYDLPASQVQSELSGNPEVSVTKLNR